MELTSKMIKQALANLADFVPMAKQASEKVALTPAVGGQIPPPVDPAMMGGAGGMPPAPGMDPAMAGGMPGGMPPAPPMDPAMAGGMPPAPPMDPGMGGAPMDPAALEGGAPAPEGGLDTSMNKPEDDQDGDGKPDVMVPLRAITEHTVGVIEATKGRRTADAAPAKTPGAEGAGPQSPISSLGGAPGAAPMSLPGLGPKQAAARIEALISALKKV